MDTMTSTVLTLRTCNIGPFFTMPLMMLFVGVNVVNANHSVQMWLVDPLSNIQLKQEWDIF